ARFNTNQKIFSNAPHVPLRDVSGAVVPIPAALAPVGLSTASIARVVAVRQEFGQYSVAISTSFNKANDRVGYLTQSGTFSVTNVPPGVYYLRTEPLRQCATCEILVPRQGLVVVATAAVTGQSITLSDGYNVSGSVRLDNSILDSGTFELTLRNKRQEVIRSTTVRLGNPVTGATANSVSYSFKNLPAKDFYTLSVKDSSSTPKYAGRPVKFPDPGLAPNGLQSDLTNQNVLLKLAAYITGKLKDTNTGVQITRNNATLLAPNFQITATANPWVEGGYVVAKSSVSGRPIRYDGTFLVGPLIPEISYDLRLGQERWDLAYLAQGSQNYAPVVLAGVTPQPAETKNVGTIGLNQGQSIKGTVVDAASTTTALGNIKVVGSPSFGQLDLVVETFTNGIGEFTLWVSTFVSRQYDVSFAPRDGNIASTGKVYKEAVLENLTVSTVPLNVSLRELLGAVTGQIVTADGGALSYPFGEQKGFPAAAVFMQPKGVVPADDPLGDIRVVSGGDGAFEVPGISTGTYFLRAVSLGYIIEVATVTVKAGTFCVLQGTTTNLCLSQLTLERGAQVTGRILLPDGSAPSDTEVGGVAAASEGFSQFVVGTVDVDQNARTVTGYTISGFEAGVVYDIVILPAQGQDVVFPPEGDNLSFAASESTSTKNINLTFTRAEPECSADFRQKAVGNDQFQVKIYCTQPLRNQLESDSDLDRIVTVSTANSKGEPYADGANSTGEILGGGERKIADNRKQVTLVYRSTSTAETDFSIKLAGVAATVNPATGENFEISKVFDFKVGLKSSKEKNITNIQGGDVELETSEADENKGKSEKFKLTLPPGALKGCSAGDSDPNCQGETRTENDSKLDANIGVNAADDAQKTEAAALSLLGYVPSKMSVLGSPKAYTEGLYRGMKAFRTLASTSTDNAFNANPFSSFYEVFLPLGIRSQLNKAVDIRLSYDISLDTSTTLDDLNVWSYSNGQVQIENDNRRVDPVNQTITVKVDHFSVFVVLASTPVVTADIPFGGGEINAFNFPNPFDCTRKTKSLNTVLVTSAGQVTFEGTLMRFSLPPGDAGEAKIKIYNVAGEVVREFSQGVLAGGFTYYTPWDCKNQGGVNVASGVYIGQINWGGKNKFFKMALIKGSGL
ncbi:MAG: hypothetical protein ABII00_18660, partial [Elusimicrobiota bacterium]